MEAEGADTVGGEIDDRKAIEVKFWRDMNANNGITDEQVLDAVDEFKPVFADLDKRLGDMNGCCRAASLRWTSPGGSRCSGSPSWAGRSSGRRTCRPGTRSCWPAKISPAK